MLKMLKREIWSPLASSFSGIVVWFFFFHKVLNHDSGAYMNYIHNIYKLKWGDEYDATCIISFGEEAVFA